MIEEIVARGDVAEHIADAALGFAFVVNTLGACSGQSRAIRRVDRIGTAIHVRPPRRARTKNAGSSRHAIATTLSGTSTPMSALPIRLGSTQRTRPARDFLSDAIARDSVEGEMRGNRGNGPQRATSEAMRLASLSPNRFMPTAISVAPNIPQPKIGRAHV